MDPNLNANSLPGAKVYQMKARSKMRRFKNPNPFNEPAIQHGVNGATMVGELLKQYQ